MTLPIPAIILAGGKSSRMGKDKALLPFCGYGTLGEFQYSKLKGYFDEVYLSTKTDKFPFSANIIQDIYPESSPLVAILSIFKTLTCETVFILSVDAPLVDENIIKKLWETYQENLKKGIQSDAIIPQSPSGIQPLCGIYKRSILPHAKRNYMSNTHQLKALLNNVVTQYVNFKDNTPFTNINTPYAYLNLLAKLN